MTYKQKRLHRIKAIPSRRNRVHSVPVFDFKLYYRAILIKTARRTEKKTADGDSDPCNYLAFSERGTKIHTGGWTASLTTVLRRLGTPQAE